MGNNQSGVSCWNRQTGDCFGNSVSVSGDTAVVGAEGRAGNTGAAYVFLRSGNTWTQQQILAASDGGSGDFFGDAVAVSGNTALVGAPLNPKPTRQGAAYVFARSGTTWSEQQKLTASNGASFDNFGISVAIDGDTAVVGAYGNASLQGPAYMYQITYLLRTAASPLTGGIVIPASGSYFYPGTTVPLQAVPNAGYGFGGWSGPVADPASVATTVTMSGPVNVVANFVPPIQVTVNTNPAGISFVVDTIAYSTAQTFSWAVGSTHQISVVAVQPGGAGTQFVWLNWSDGQAASHTVAPTTATTYTANFKTQFQLAVQVGSGGTVTPQTAFFDAASSVNISASPNAGFTFSGWTGSGAGSYTGANPNSSVTMSGPLSETAAFAPIGFTARLNAGGTVYNDPQGNLWSPDPNLANTFTFLTQNPIRNTSKAYLYQSERFSLGTSFQYVFPSVANGTYNVRLLFAETYFTQPGQRKFNVNINGAAALTNFDIVAAAGGSNTAIDTLHSVNVTNGQITIQFVPVVSNPKISAIEITPQAAAVALSPGISDPLAAGTAQQFTATVVGNANTAVSYTLSPNIGNITAGGLYTAAAVQNPTRVTLTATSQADNTKSATAIVQLVPQAWTSQDVGTPNAGGSSAYAGNAFNLGGAGDLLGTSDAFRFTYNKLSGDGSIVARVNQPFTGQTSNKSGVMMRGDLTPGSSYGFTGLYSSIVGLFHWRQTASGPTSFQFGAAGVPWVRLTRTGSTIASYVSNDAAAWIPVGTGQTLPAVGTNVGLAASNGFGGVLDTVTFDNIELSTSPVAVSINEGLSSLAAGQQAQFTANVTGTGNTAVTWSISPAGQGTIDPNTGLYTAPGTINPTPQTVTVTATSVADPSRSASVVVYLGGFQVIRVNCGGPSHYDPTGTFWYGDVGAVGGAGNVYSAGNPIANTLTPYLYQSERFMANAALVYKYYVPNGSYNVTLKFAEIYFGSAGQRVMNVSINGTTVLTNFDVVAQGGANTAVDRTFPVVVTNGSITISLAPAVAGHAPKVNAIQIQ